MLRRVTSEVSSKIFKFLKRAFNYLKKASKPAKFSMGVVLTSSEGLVENFHKGGLLRGLSHSGGLLRRVPQKSGKRVILPR